MDLPNLVEKWRTDYIFGAMEIPWRGEFENIEFLHKQSAMADLGWEVFEEEYMERPSLDSYYRVDDSHRIHRHTSC